MVWTRNGESQFLLFNSIYSRGASAFFFPRLQYNKPTRLQMQLIWIIINVRSCFAVQKIYSTKSISIEYQKYCNAHSHQFFEPKYVTLNCFIGCFCVSVLVFFVSALVRIAFFCEKLTVFHPVFFLLCLIEIEPLWKCICIDDCNDWSMSNIAWWNWLQNMVAWSVNHDKNHQIYKTRPDKTRQKTKQHQQIPTNLFLARVQIY